MEQTEPVKIRSRRSRRLPFATLTVALATGMLAALIGGPAAASPESAEAQVGGRAELHLVSPARGSSIYGTTELEFTGSRLVEVVVYRGLHEVGSADFDGGEATVVIDSTEFPDRRVLLTAIGFTRDDRRGIRAAEIFTLKVDNAHGDGHPEGAELVFADDFSGDELDRGLWCTRLPWWEPTSQPSPEEAAAAAAANPGCVKEYPLTDVEIGKTTSVLDKYAAESAKALAAGETEIAAWYDKRFGEIATNNGVAVADDGSYDFSNALAPVYGTLDSLGGLDIRPAPNAPEWELPQEEEVYRDVNSAGQPTHTVQDGYLSMWATHTRQEAPVLQYESGLIRTEQEFLPTWDAPLYLTTRVRAPEVLGTFPAFWVINGFPEDAAPGWPPEIDFYEGPYNNDGSQPKGDRLGDMYHVGLVDYLCEDACGPIEWFDIANPYDPGAGDPMGYDDGFHDYRAGHKLVGEWIEVGVAWYPDRVCFYAEGEKFACATYRWGLAGSAADGPLGSPATVILNQAFGGRWSGANGEQTDLLPASFDVDHVRIYELPATSPEELAPLP